MNHIQTNEIDLEINTKYDDLEEEKSIVKPTIIEDTLEIDFKQEARDSFRDSMTKRKIRQKTFEL